MSLGKIILRSTTRISLNDRFTVLRNENPTTNNQYDAGAENRQMIQASRKNQRLAAQMERRPAVIAALKTKKAQNISNRLNGHQQQQQVSVKQRLALPGRIRVPETSRGSSRGLRRGLSSRIRGVSGGKFQGRIGTDIRSTTSSAFSGLRGGRFIGGRGGSRGRGGMIGRGAMAGRGGMGRGAMAGRGGQLGRGRGRGFSRGRGFRGFSRGT